MPSKRENLQADCQHEVNEFERQHRVSFLVLERQGHHQPLQFQQSECCHRPYKLREDQADIFQAISKVRVFIGVYHQYVSTFL